MYDYCPEINLKVKQDKNMFRMNTDSYALGKFIHIKSSDVVLDVGTNNGVLLLYASVYNPQKLIGIDVFQEAIALATFNLKLNNIHNYELSTMPFQDYEGKCNVIVCNPPYFVGENKKDNHFLHTARHEENLPMETLFCKSKQVLESKGKLFVIYPAFRLEEMILLGNKYGFSLKRMKLNYKKSKKRAHTVCAEFVKDSKKHVVIEMGDIIA